MGSRFLGGCKALMEASKASANATKSGGSGLTKLVPISPQLGKFLGGVHEASRSLVVKKVWEYIKLHNLQVIPHQPPLLLFLLLLLLI